jgi:hypothetical protein
MATYKQFRLGDLAPAQAGFGLLGPDCRSLTLLGGQHRVPLFSIVYPMGEIAEQFLRKGSRGACCMDRLAGSAWSGRERRDQDRAGR